LHTGVAITLSSSDTEAVSEITRPHPIVAPVWITSPAFEMIVPRKVVVVPRVAPDGATHVMLPVNALPADPALITSTVEPLPVMSELLMMNVHVEPLLPCAFSTSMPPAVKSNVPEATSYTPGISVAPLKPPAPIAVPVDARPKAIPYAAVASPKGVPAPEFATPVVDPTAGAFTIPGPGDVENVNPVTEGVPDEPATFPKMTLAPVFVTPASPNTAKGAAVPIATVSARVPTANIVKQKDNASIEINRNFIFFPI
jgi:hypothetical protein